MYLMKFEAEEDPSAVKYDRFVVYGLDALLKQVDDENDKINEDQLRLSNLIFNAAFRIKRKHSLKAITFVPFDDNSDLTMTLQRLERYWRHVC